MRFALSTHYDATRDQPSIRFMSISPTIPSTAIARSHNFSAGPGALPDCVLQQASEAIQRLTDLPLSVLGVSHRSPWFTNLIDELEANLRQLIGLPPEFHCLFLQGGGTLQFSMIPMNFLRGQSRPSAYLDTGYWSQKAIPEARREGTVELLWSGEATGYTRLPTPAELDASRSWSYLHYASNETVEGLQFQTEPPVHPSTARICDMSSDFLSRPFDANRYAMIYAHAQKNLGPAGVNICLVHDSLLERCSPELHAMLDYRNHIQMRSAYNTPPVFAIYVVMLVTRWLMNDVGGLAAMQHLNETKAKTIYAAIDNSGGFYRGRVARESRSLMNVAFNIHDARLETLCWQEAEQAGFYGLAGHRSVGGLRASLYNPVTVASCEALAEFLNDFRSRHG